MMTQLAARPVSQAVEFLFKVSKEIPSFAVVLGSGVKVLEDLPEQVNVSYEEVFGISPGVVGHAGSLTLGRVGGKLVAVLRGRFHLYEGYDFETVTLPARVVREWGVPNLYLTNAAGGMNESFHVGDLMLITGYKDHLHPRYQQTGLLPALKSAPVDCRNKLTDHLLAVSKRLNVQDVDFRSLRTGVYAGLLGPSYETLAEIDMLKKLKADAVGMSTVTELEAVRGSSTTAAAISVVTNVWSPDEIIGGHEEVLTAAREASQRLDRLFRAAIADYSPETI